MTSLLCMYKRVEIPKIQWYRLTALRILNHNSGHTFWLFIVVLVFVDVEQSVVMCVCVCVCVCVHVRQQRLSQCCGAVLYHIVKCCIAPVEGNISKLRTQDQKKRSHEQTVTLQTHTVSAEALAFRTHQQEDGLVTGSKSGTPQHRHQLIVTSIRPQAGHDINPLCQATLYLMG